MKTVTIRDFRTRPRAVSEALSRNEDAVLTVNGKPLAIMIPVTPETFDEAIDLVHRMRAIRAVRDIRLRATRTGADKLSLSEIDKIIAKSRAERRAQAKRTGRH
jgi:antitoxin (DNA-binding transcriptional repressor) of toxin-antitoxin stability system